MKHFYLFFLLAFTFSCSKSENTKSPNILFIMSDDHAYQAISAYDQRLIQTPNIDRIANEGILFQMLQLQIQYVRHQEPLYLLENIVILMEKLITENLLIQHKLLFLNCFKKQVIKLQCLANYISEIILRALMIF